jgi:hypothetical protein
LGVRLTLALIQLAPQFQWLQLARDAAHYLHWLGAELTLALIQLAPQFQWLQLARDAAH